jgi:hypothetical protein
MAETSYYPYLGSGKIYARVAGTATGRLELGNASKLELEVKEDKQKLKDYTKQGGGTYASVARVDTVTLKMTLHDLNKTNVARAVFGSEASVTGAAVLDEVVTAYTGAICPLAHPAPTAVVVTNFAGTTTYVENTDYEVRPGGIFILAGGAIAAAITAAGATPVLLKVDYSFAGYNKVEALTSGSQTLELFFEGLNEANSGKPVLVDVWRAQLSPTKALSLLGDKFADLEVEAEVLKDSSKVGVGISQYFRARLA